LGDFDKENSEEGCDLTTTTSDIRDQLPVLNILLNYFKDPAVKVIQSASTENELLLFNMRDNYPDSSNPLASNVVRKVISLCLNRDKVIKDLSFGLYTLPDATFFTKSRSSTQEMVSYAFDPAAGSALLDQAGWKDQNGQSKFPRISNGISDIADNTELRFTYLVEDSGDNLRAAEIFKVSLSECGIDINIKTVPTEIYWDLSQKDSIFQGTYDLAQLSWAAPITNPCPLFSSQFIPLKDNNFLGANFRWYRNEEFDKSCYLLNSTYLSTDREALLEELESIIQTDLPAIPLYSYSKLMVAQKDFCIERLAIKSDNELTGIEGFDISPACQ
jgi:peptide/nickel transport system substrate-binding protein